MKIGEYLNLGELSVIGTYNIEAILLAKNIVPLKYMYDVETADAGYEKTGTTEGGINVFENKDMLPFGFLVNKMTLDVRLEDRGKDTCKKQNALLYALAGCQEIERKVFLKTEFQTG